MGPARRRRPPTPSPHTLPRSWCPHCRAFKPTYEKVAAFCGKNTGIKVYRVDCALEVRRWGLPACGIQRYRHIRAAAGSSSSRLCVL